MLNFSKKLRLRRKMSVRYFSKIEIYFVIVSRSNNTKIKARIMVIYINNIYNLFEPVWHIYFFENYLHNCLYLKVYSLQE